MENIEGNGGREIRIEIIVRDKGDRIKEKTRGDDGSNEDERREEGEA